MGVALSPVSAVWTMLSGGLRPLVPYPGAATPWPCECMQCGREVTPKLNNIDSGWGGCGWCSGHRKDPGELVSVMRSVGLEPLTPYPGSHIPWRCRCSTCGREVSPTFAEARKKSAPGCNYCTGSRVQGEAAAAAMLAAGVRPLETYRTSATPWRCECLRCGRVVTPRYSEVVKAGGGGCAFCAGKKVDPAEAEAVMRSMGLEPLEPYGGTHVPWRCRCVRCGHEVTPRFHHVRRGKSKGCRFCAPNRSDAVGAVAVMRAAGLEPLEPYERSRSPWRCQCTRCGTEVTPTFGGVSSGQGGCKHCARHCPIDCGCSVRGDARENPTSQVQLGQFEENEDA
jgi:hypothetical protein